MQIKVKKIHTFTGHRDCIYALSGSAGMNQIFSAGGEGFIAKWDLRDRGDGQLLAKVDSSVYAIHHLSDQNLLIVGQNNEGIHLIDPAKKKIVGSLKMTDSTIFDIESTGNDIFIATGDGVLVVVDLEKLVVKGKFRLSEKSLRSIAIDANSGTVAVGASDDNVYVFDIPGETLLKKLVGHTNSVFSLKYSDSSPHLVSVGRDAHINFWSVENDFALETSIPAHMYAINHVEFRNDGRIFATGSMDKTIKIWDSDKRKLLKVIDKERHEGHLSSVNKLYWSPFNNYLVSASDDRTISVWDLELNY